MTRWRVWDWSGGVTLLILNFCISMKESSQRHLPEVLWSSDQCGHFRVDRLQLKCDGTQ